MAPLIGNGLLPLPSNINATVYGEITLLTVIHKNVPVQYAAVYRVNRDASYSLIGQSEALGKDDSAGAVAFPDGTVRLYVSEADPGQSGTTSKVHYYDFANAIPPFPNLYYFQQQLNFLHDKINKIQQKLFEAGSI